MDDMGYGDLSCYGSTTYRTHNIDKLASEGIRFTNFLTAQAVCSASRAALLTGCYPNRMNIHGAYFPGDKVGLNPNETTIAEMLKQKGYRTAIYGKWHLGDEQKFLPLQQGFDEYFGIPYSNDMWPVEYDGTPAGPGTRKERLPRLPLILNNEVAEYVNTLEDQAQLTRKYTEKAVDFIERNKKKQFFLYLPHSMPHVPIAVSSRFQGITGQGLYADLMMEIDWSVGEIVKTLEATGLDKNTMIIFTSDNGPWINYGNHAGSSGGFREGKGTSYEGGHRVPAIIKWKGKVPAGLICNQLCSTIDILPTLAAICGTSLPDNKIDGVNIQALLEGDMSKKPRQFFAYYYHRNSLEAVRKDQWKLVFPHKGRSYMGQLPGSDGYPGPAPENNEEPFALYDLRRDPAEQYDVQKKYPEIVKELEAYGQSVRAELGDDLTNTPGTQRRPLGTL